MHVIFCIYVCMAYILHLFHCLSYIRNSCTASECNDGEVRLAMTLKVEWKFATMECGELVVTITGADQMLKWCAGS